MKSHTKVIRAIDRALATIAEQIAGKRATRLLSDFDHYARGTRALRALPDVVIEGRQAPTTRRQREFLQFLSEANRLLQVREMLSA